MADKLKHLYACFWRPDILNEFQGRNVSAATMCDTDVPAYECTTVMQVVTCPACRETFLNAALPTGDGSRLTWDEYVKREAARETIRKADAGNYPRSYAQRQADAKAAGASWSTTMHTETAPVPGTKEWVTKLDNVPSSQSGWSTKPGPQTDAMNAPQKPYDTYPGKGDGWQTKK